MKVLITCGPTWVAIDDVRVISNTSSGEMGHLIAALFKASGAKVTLVEGPVTHALEVDGINVLKYRFFDELKRILLNECRKKYDVIIHAAAVSDFKPVLAVKGKISSTKAMTLKLLPTEKIIGYIKKIAPDACVVGFKLESKITPRTVKRLSEKLVSEAGCDLVLVNTLRNGYQGYILDADQNILGHANNKRAIARQLVRIFA